MVALYIILGIVLLFFLLSLLRLGVRAEFAGALENTRVTVIAGPARIQVLPKPDKSEKANKEKKEKRTATQKAQEKPGQKQKKIDLSPQDIRTLLPAAWEALKKGLRKTRQRLRIDPMELSAALPGAMDPAGAAELYGYINAGMWTVMPQLEKLTRIPDPRLHVEVDFDDERLKLNGRVGVTLQIRDLFAIGWAFAKPLLKWFMAMRKRQSAAEKEAAARAKAAEAKLAEAAVAKDGGAGEKRDEQEKK